MRSKIKVICFSSLVCLVVSACPWAGWIEDGIPLTPHTGYGGGMVLVSDGSSGAFIAYEVCRDAASYITVQRLDSEGDILWGDEGVVVCSEAGGQYSPQITSDGSGGLIVAWSDYRSGSYDIYAQRVDGSGTVLWQADGVPLCTEANSQYAPQITSDGSGGAIVTWQDARSGNSDIYAQHVDGSGSVQWQTDGVPLCTAEGDQYKTQIISDGSSGAIVTWEDERSGEYVSDIYAQRVDATGLTLWQADGVPLCTAAGWQLNPKITSSGSGGAIVIWNDDRSYSYDIYAQRVDGSGMVQWQTDGIPLCMKEGNQRDPQITSDGSVGAIVTWSDPRSVNPGIYAQRVDFFGTTLWQVDGVPICTAVGYQRYPQITSDGSGGAIVTWGDERSGYYFSDIYAQRVDGAGSALWTANGVPICTAANSQVGPQITSDGSGGAIVTWCDRRSGGYDIYAQRVDGSGTILWQADGVPLCTAAEWQDDVQITIDGSGGAIVMWGDRRSGYYDIYAQRVDGSGLALWQADGIPICTAVEFQLSPQITTDGSGGAIVTWWDFRSGSYSDIYAQRVDGSGTVQWQADGIPLCTAAEDQEYPQIATDEAGGAIVTWHDYRCSIPHIYVARVSGSGDLVATLLQTFSARLESNSVFISWTLSEIDESASFTVLRASAPDWIYSEIENAAIEREGLSFSFTDTAVLPGSLCKYRIDVETESTPTRTLFETEEITVPALPLTLYQNHPNPFNPNTTIRFYLPEAGEVSLDIYNVAGQRVRRLAEGRMEKGYQEVLWDGRNSAGADCSSGIYFYRLRAGKSSISKKMVLLR